MAKRFPSFQFVVAKAPGIDDTFYDDLLAPYSNVESVSNKTYELLAKASAALVTSGTATLETALFGVPEIVCYKGSLISFEIAKRLIKIKYICLVNLIMDKEVVKELIQHEFTTDNLSAELSLILINEEKRNQLKIQYKLLKEKLTEGGSASKNAAKIIYSYLQHTH